MIQKLVKFANRYAKYAAMRMVIMGTLYVFVSSVELTELVDVDKMSILPSFTETTSIYSHLQSMEVILARAILNLSHHSDYITSIETLYALYKLFDVQNDELCLFYCWYSFMKFTIKKVLVCAWNMNESGWAAIVNNPSNIRSSITLQQIDQIEFNMPHLKITRGIFMGMFSGMLNYDLIFRAMKQWCYTKIIQSHMDF